MGWYSSSYIVDISHILMHVRIWLSEVVAWIRFMQCVIIIEGFMVYIGMQRVCIRDTLKKSNTYIPAPVNFLSVLPLTTVSVNGYSVHLVYCSILSTKKPWFHVTSTILLCKCINILWYWACFFLYCFLSYCIFWLLAWLLLFSFFMFLQCSLSICNAGRNQVKGLYRVEETAQII